MEAGRSPEREIWIILDEDEETTNGPDAESGTAGIIAEPVAKESKKAQPVEEYEVEYSGRVRSMMYNPVEEYEVVAESSDEEEFHAGTTKEAELEFHAGTTKEAEMEFHAGTTKDAEMEFHGGTAKEAKMEFHVGTAKEAKMGVGLVGPDETLFGSRNRDDFDVKLTIGDEAMAVAAEQGGLKCEAVTVSMFEDDVAEKKAAPMLDRNIERICQRSTATGQNDETPSPPGTWTPPLSPVLQTGEKIHGGNTEPQQSARLQYDLEQSDTWLNILPPSAQTGENEASTQTSETAPEQCPCNYDDELGEEVVPEVSVLASGGTASKSTQTEHIHTCRKRVWISSIKRHFREKMRKTQ